MKTRTINLQAFRAEGRTEGRENPAAQERKRAFDELIKGEYKADFEERVRSILDRRFKTVNAERAATRPILRLLCERYGVAEGDGMADALLEALQKDDSYLTAAAGKAGMTPEQYQRVMRAEGETKALRAQLERQRDRQRSSALHRYLSEQAEQLREQYPDFDLRKELEENERFSSLLRRGVDMQTAYQICHQKELLDQAVQEAEIKALGRVRANRSRPAENGSGGGQPVKLGSDPSKWSREQFREIGRRVSRGERIVL